ncbi:helix-hairpin-helix domain-containing protein [Streptomyces roseoviridis]|uniref:Helix-hairpin-helix domain-containing protein n=1 Tax=Streptomyces roseoviridis TaxID=67361 RepID=A0ABV5QHW1_9ACTN
MTEPSGENTPEAADALTPRPEAGPADDAAPGADTTAPADPARTAAGDGPASADGAARSADGTEATAGAPEAQAAAQETREVTGRDEGARGEAPGDDDAEARGPAAEEPEEAGDAESGAGRDDDTTAEATGQEAPAGSDAEGEAETGDGTPAGNDAEGEAETGNGTPAGNDAAAREVSAAEAELAAQRELRARIEQRKAERGGPVEAGAKLSGTAADLLAAVRAVESGARPVAVPRVETPAPPRPVAAAAPETTVRPPVPPAPVVTEETTASVRQVLGRGGAPETLAGPVATVLGEGAARALQEDPWQLLAVPGVRPEQADGFARALLGPQCGPADPRRVVALTAWLLEQAALKGHTALEIGAVREGLGRLAVPEPDQAVDLAVSEAAVLVFQEEDEEEQDGQEEPAEGGAGGSRPEVPVLLGLERYALAEESLADGVARLIRTVRPEQWDGPELARAAGGHGLVLHTGGEAARAEPVALARQARARGLRAAVAAHTTREGAVTVAGLLSGAAGPGRDAEGALALDLLVVLDAPQLDVESAAALVEALPDGCRLVLSGDPHVLGSAGPGRVFADLLAARVVPQIASRTPDPGPIGELVSGVGVGELTQVDAPGKEVVIVPVRDAGEAVHRTVQLVADSIPRALGVPAGQTQVITVGHGGSAGTRALNAALKQRLNPGPGRFGGYDPGDRVAHSPAPGRTVTGTVVSADAEGLHLDCAGERVVVPKERVESSLRHGWALTAHQAVGSCWPAAVVVLPGDAAAGLSRAWVYTAFGRAERHLSVVHGVDQALPRAVAEGRTPERTTRLRPLLETLLHEDEA